MIPAALETLKNVVTTYDSSLSREAIRTAYALVEGAREKKNKELEGLNQGLNIIGDVSQAPGSESTPEGVINFEWTMDNDWGLSDFLDSGGYYGFENDRFPPPNLQPYTGTDGHS